MHVNLLSLLTKCNRTKWHKRFTNDYPGFNCRLEFILIFHNIAELFIILMRRLTSERFISTSIP